MSRWSWRARLLPSAVLCGLIALPLSAIAPLHAQETIVIGGTGQSSVEINLDAIEQIGRLPERLPNLLLHPGVDEGGAGHIKLRPPGQTTRRASDDPPRVVARRPVTPRVEAPTPPTRTEQPLRPEAPLELVERAADLPIRIEPSAKPAPEPAPEPAREPAPEPEAQMEATLDPVPAPVREPEPEPEDDPVVNIPIPEPEKEPPPAPVTAEPAEERESQIAALTPGDAPSEPGEMMRVAFPPGDAKLPRTSEAALQTLAAKLQADESLRLQLKAYAGGDVESASQARRLSLSRALAVRSYFIDQGLRSTRIDVRALGNRTEDGPSERVDIILKQR